MKRCFLTIRSAAFSALLFASVEGRASNFFLDFDGTFSGISPVSSGPWASMLFQDVGPGTVSLTISNLGLSGNEFISELDFNLHTNLNPTSLVFANVGGSGGFTLPAITTGLNFQKADGDGFYDIEFSFGTAAGTRFTVGDYVVYQISGIGSLTANDFAFLSNPASGGGAGPFLAAAHIQSIGVGAESGWVSPSGVAAVPEPTSACLMAIAVGVGIFGRPLLRRRVS